VQDAQSFEDLQQTLALLSILVTVHKRIEAGDCLSAADLFTEIGRLDRQEGVERERSFSNRRGAIGRISGTMSSTHVGGCA
jgi:hypothetical protein